MMGLEFLLGHSEDIKRQNDIKGGIYTARAVKGIWAQGGKTTSYGYVKEGRGDDRKLVIIDEQAYIVRYIFEAFLQNTPLIEIKNEVKKLGFDKTGNSAITDTLSNPIYCGYQRVTLERKSWRVVSN